MEEKFYRRMWENVLERVLKFGDVEINEYHKGTKPCDWYGTFKFYSHLIDGVERTYFFKIINNEIRYVQL